MPAEKLIQYLQSQNVSYEIIKHDPEYTAQEIAASAHVSGKKLAKTVMVKLDGALAMAVLPAATRVNFQALKDASGASEVKLASEKEFHNLFPDCEMGAMPPFGNLYGLQVYVADSFSEHMLIAFCAGSHTELIQMSYQDFARLVKPKVLRFTWQA